MKLKDYFIKSRVTPTEFAENHDISVTSIYKYLRGKKPRFETARKIEKWTNGQVTVEDLIYDEN